MKKNVNMIKFWIGITLELITVFAVSITNNVVLLNLHPLEYYYTLPGMGLTMAAATIEIPIVLLLIYVIYKLLIKPMANDVKKS